MLSFSQYQCLVIYSRILDQDDPGIARIEVRNIRFVKDGETT